MSSVREINATTVWHHGLERLRALAEPSRSAEAAVATERGRLARAINLHGILLGIARAALWKGYDRLGLRSSVAAANTAPTSLKANVAAATACRRANDPVAALVFGHRAAENDDASKRGNWELAKVLIGIRRATAKADIPELLSALREASSSSVSSIRHSAALALSDVLRDVSEYAAAEAAAEIVLSTAPSQLRALRAKADSLVPQHRFAEAASLYGMMMQQDPNNAEFARKHQVLAQLAQEAPPEPYPTPSANRAKQPFLIGVGSGIGDVLHATPMIRNIARRTGAPVEVVVAGDHANMEFLAADPRYVSRVWSVSRAVLQRQYKTVFLTQFFGPLHYAFHADRTVVSSQWRTFRGGMLNDTLINLEAAKHLLDVPYDESDVQQYFAGSLVWQPPKQTLVGLHAGSKSGRWISKRWPYFAPLASWLSSRGIRVASFGTPAEYVAGTEDRTGGTIEEMARAMLDCSYFISNDSGPMHIANALGIPVLAIFGPTDPLTHLPIRASTRALALDKFCAPCEVKNHRHFASGACRCVAEISAETIERKIVKMIQGLSIARASDIAPLAVKGAA